MQRLLKRRKVQECLEETEKEMGDTGMSLNDLESLLNEEGIDTKIDTLPTKRIASNVSTRFLLIRDVKKALAEAKQRNQAQNNPTTSKIEEISEIDDNIKATTSKDTEIIEVNEEKPKKVDELEDDLQKAIQMSLECVDEPKQDTSVVSKTDDSWTSCMTDTDYSDTDSEEGDGFEQPDMTCAKAYIMQYSDFTHQAIDKIVTDRHKGKKKKKVPKVNEILDEINKEKSIIVDNVELSSGDESDDGAVVISSSEENNKITAIAECSSSSEDQETEKYLDSTQASVICVENPVQEVIDLDSSIEEESIKTDFPLENLKQESNSSDEIEEVTNNENKSGSESSDSDFEEVPEENTEVKKPIVELTLNMGNAPDDDIFADIFENPEKPKDIKEAINEIKTNNEVLTPKSSLVDNVFKVPEVPVLKTSSKMIPQTILSPDSETDKNSGKPNETNVDNADITAIQDNVEPTKLSETPDLIVESEKQIQLVKTPNPPKQTLTTEQLTSMVEDMQNEEQDLMQEKGRLDRIGRNITEQMTKEAQELLQIFGIPYIVAPMEAEAQCAFLESVNLTDGTITDDSDIWLFGGRTVYKNFFNQKKHVLQFLAERIEKSFSKYTPSSVSRSRCA